MCVFLAIHIYTIMDGSGAGESTAFQIEYYPDTVWIRCRIRDPTDANANVSPAENIRCNNSHSTRIWNGTD